MVQYDGVDAAKDALNSVKGTFIKNSRKLMVSISSLAIIIVSISYEQV
jgi:hypothetical protein